MTYTSALRAGRRAAEKLMDDTVTVERQTGTTFDDSTGAETPTWTTVYSGKAKLQQRGLPHVTQTEAGATEAMVATTMVHLPAGTTGVDVGDRVTVDTSTNPSLAGRQMVIVGRPAKTHETAVRFQVEEQQQ